MPYYTAFTVLSAARRQGTHGWDALAYSEIVAYAERNGFAATMEELEEFVSLIQVQDAAFLAATAPKPKRVS